MRKSILTGFAFLVLIMVALLSGASSARAFSFVRNLTVGAKGPDVIALQTGLVKKHLLVIPSGVSMGYFGKLTRDGVSAYQRLKGIKPAVGFFGPITRGIFSLDASVAGDSSDDDCRSTLTGEPCTVPPPDGPCTGNDIFNNITGARCSDLLPAGCTLTTKFSSTTGHLCVVTVNGGGGGSGGGGSGGNGSNGGSGGSVTSIFSSILLSPTSATLGLGTTEQFSATALDQNGNALATQPSITWSTTAGNITNAGLLTAPQSSATVTVTASYGGKNATATIIVSSTIPALNSIFPLSGPVGTQVTVAGANLQLVSTSGHLGNIAVSGSVNYIGTSFTFTVPSGTPTGAASVTLNYNGQQISGVSFTVTAPGTTPAITGLSASSGTISLFSITGNNSGNIDGSIATDGEPVTLHLTTTGATSCRVDGPSTALVLDLTNGSEGATGHAGTYTLTCYNSANAAVTATKTVTLSQTPSVTLSVGSNSIAYGGATTLTWSSSNVTSCTGTGFSTGNAIANANVSTGALTATKTFSIVCTGTHGTSNTASQTVTVSGAPTPSVTLNVGANSVAYGGSTYLTWSSSNVTSCTGTGNGFNALGGATAYSATNASTGALTATTVFTITCTGSYGTATASKTVTVTGAPTPSVTLNVGSNSVAYGGATTLTWSSSNVTSCTGTGFNTGLAIANSNVSTGALTATKTFSIVCTGTYGSSNTASQTVTVAGAPTPSVTLTVGSNSVAYGGATTLTWTSSNVTSCTGTNFNTGLAIANSNVSTGALTATKTYSIVCTGSYGSSNTASQTVTVAGPPLACTLTSSISTGHITDTVTFTINPTNGTAPFTYAWNINGTNRNETTQQIGVGNWGSAGTKTVTGTVTSGGQSASCSESYTVLALADTQSSVASVLESFGHFLGF
ncbi:MAG: hypothetical protein PHV93_01175 [Candidatus Pacebacteria bacterium]|nr:hypothetical protein [Candidatus Paceibacterota bacterium]